MSVVEGSGLAWKCVVNEGEASRSRAGPARFIPGSGSRRNNEATGHHVTLPPTTAERETTNWPNTPPLTSHPGSGK
jgi:hypothetical protein